jgi:hypothetical protein
MSFLSKIWKGVRGVAAPLIGGAIGGPVGAAIGTALGGSSRVPSAIAPQVSAVPPASPVNWGALTPAAFPLPSSGGGPAMAGGMILKSLPGIGTAAAGAGMAYRVGKSAGRLFAAASSYCRRNPQWCASVGGMAAVEAMVRSGQLPAPKRRRGRGITATELRNFKRVAKFTSKYCAPVRRAMSAPVMRKGR